MDAIIRKRELEKIKQDSSNVQMTGIPLRYKSEIRKENVYKIPLEYLIYNKYNGRIGTEVQSYETQNGPLNPEVDTDKIIIEKFLYDSKQDRNKKTMESLLKNGQQRYGIVTADGKIVDGNRRASLLNKLFAERTAMNHTFSEVEHCQYFFAIILPDDATEKDMQQLETIYQMGEDDKLDYNAIEKYLKCKELKKYFTNKDIADFMGEESEKQIKKWLDILELMEEYLDTYGYTGIYTRLEKTEGPFVDLQGYLESYKNRSANTSSVDWAYDESDISDLKLVCFDYIRARYEGKEFRDIAKTGKEGSIFAHKDIWDEFKKMHMEIPNDEECVDVLRAKQPNEELSQLLRSRDIDWSKKVKSHLEGNLRRQTSKLEDKRDANQPLKLLERAYNAINSVDTSQDGFFDNPRVLEYIKDISKITWDMKKLLDRK
ncbi:hypothetical protein [Lachnoclostridium phytofermentans]|uniref:ParB/Sulfiredoxin domain-containing protein n=1 Tax=Lachnoclostridium phytofermentans (strain ATCC 700394 / DSM 18823 / ISDg) TaxID=357809 RepID=A9KPK7_LACP7|nr:hypothetical protein [Lachnoclostridium phytofermentans]ABX43281.1 hypothetical protein Cphy_2923 [Lachnoclostridium phytofermentans ISDg]